jgi:hypothetical protein
VRPPRAARSARGGRRTGRVGEGLARSLDFGAHPRGRGTGGCGGRGAGSRRFGRGSRVGPHAARSGSAMMMMTWKKLPKGAPM